MNEDELDLIRKDRGSRVRRTTIWGVIYQGVYSAAQLLALALLARYLSKEQYGLWMTILALAAWMPMSSLGQNAVLLTKLGAVAYTDHKAARRIFSSSLMLVGLATGLLLASLIAAAFFLPWQDLLGVGSWISLNMLVSTSVSAIAVSLLATPAILVGFAIFAHQRGDLVHMCMSAGSLVALALTFMAIQRQQPLWVVGCASLIGPLLGGLVVGFIGFLKGLVPVPSPVMVEWKMSKNLLEAGLLFLFTDVALLLLQRTPDMMVAYLSGIGEVGPFATIGRIPLLMVALFQALLLPFWPALGEAAHRNDMDWIRQTVRRTFLLVMAVWAMSAVGFASLGRWLITLWMGSAEFADYDLILASCLQSLGLGLFSWLFILLGALSMQRMTVLASGLTALLFFPLALLLGTWQGPVGVALAQAISLLLCGVPIGCIILFRYMTSRADGVGPIRT